MISIHKSTFYYKVLCFESVLLQFTHVISDRLRISEQVMNAAAQQVRHSTAVANRRLKLQLLWQRHNSRELLVQQNKH
ncbi:hypothetical protein EXN66_Car016296 [Channa argus]|uniref:Uncharacterized protein n=1 Tax=Channa argus TaxID=215402 RepID=A0A6G1QDX8_CHAAH|nr:hypothetical protein EXN66_Car016296 [Channa argus]